MDGAGESLVFHRRAWLEVLAETQGAQLERYGLYADPTHSNLVGVMPVLLGRFGPFRVGGSPLVVEDTPYMGPVVPSELMASALVAVREEVGRKASFFRTLLPGSLSQTARDALEKEGFEVTTKTTHRLDLTVGVEALWDQLEGRCRTAVRRARKGGVEVRRVREPTAAQIQEYYSIVEEVFGAQQRKPPNPLAFFEELWSRVPAGSLSMILAELDGEIIAGIMLAHDRHRVYYIDGASLYAYRKLNASNLLLWDAMEWAAEDGRDQFDFVGSDIPRLARFKESFGGRLTEHSCVEWARSRAVWMAREWWGKHGHVMLERLRHVKRRVLPDS